MSNIHKVIDADKITYSETRNTLYRDNPKNYILHKSQYEKGDGYMGCIDQALDNESFPSESALDMVEESDGTGGARSGTDGWVRPTCPRTSPNPCYGSGSELAALDEKNQTAIPVTLVTSPTTGLTVAVTREAGNTPKIDCTVNVKLTIIMNNNNNAHYVTTYSLHKGATLLVRRGVHRLVYVTVK